MPRYYFDLYDQFGELKDEVGEELKNDAAARREAIRTATAIARETIDSDGTVIVEVKSETSPAFRLVLTVAISGL